MTVKVVHFSAKRAYAFEMTDDTVGAPVYGTGQRLNCVRKIGFERNVAEAMLEGDGGVCDATRENKSINFELDFGGVELDLIALIQGATLNEITGPPAESHLIVGTEDVEIAFGVITRVLGRRGGSAHIALFNCREQGGGYTAAEIDNYGKTTFKGIGLASPYNEKALYAVWHSGQNVEVDTTWADNVVTNLTGSY